MSVTIWRPRGYVDGFSYLGGEGGTYPINGDPLEAPFNRDTKVREVARFTGWKQSYWCDTGEFEITTDQVKPADVKKGYMVEIDGEHFVIEDVNWIRDEEGYYCTFSGRDFWKFPESQIAHRWIGESFHITGYDDAFTGETLARAVSDWFTTMAAGWWRDRLRFPRADAGTGWQNWDRIVTVKLPQGTSEEDFFEKVIHANVTDVMSYASEWRMFCSWFNMGLRFDFTFNDASGVYEIEPVLYGGQDNGLFINTASRGVSDIDFQENSRGTVNASFCMFESKFTYSPVNVNDYAPDDYQGYLYDHGTEETYRAFCYGIKDDAASFSERAQFFSEKYVDAGQAQEAAVISEDAMRAWIKAQAENDLGSDEVAFKFNYDGTGAYKYGVHFGLGDYITIVDDYLGIMSKQRLSGVKTVYDAGDFKRYELEFNNQRISRADVTKRKFAEINRRTYGKGKQG